MTQRYPTVTIGIPAYNEEANIKFLLEDILRQVENGFQLEKIIVNSDGSSDRTAEIVRSFSDPRIVIMENRERKGQAERQNQILRGAESDILVLLNADIVLEGRYFLKTLIQPLLDSQAAFSSSRMLSTAPYSFVERILTVGMNFKNETFEGWREGKNLYTCHGAARAFSHAYYEHFQFHESVGEDAYSYFYGLANGFPYAYAINAVSRIKLPRSLTDHFKQSVRFYRSRHTLVSEFGADLVEREYALPKRLLIRMALSMLFSHPILFSSYVMVTLYSQWQALSPAPATQLWEIATSSKNVRA